MNKTELLSKSVYGDVAKEDEQYLSVDIVKEFLGYIETTIDEILSDMKCRYGFSDLDNAQEKLEELSEDLG